jgi:hypothetical protein
MELWTLWLGAIQSLLTFLSSQLGLGEGLSIVALTLLLRTDAIARRIKSGAVSI